MTMSDEERARLQAQAKLVSAAFQKRFPNGRERERIDRMLGLIGEIWHQYPDLRLLQMLHNIGIPDDPYYVEDDKLEQGLRDLYGDGQTVGYIVWNPKVDPNLECDCGHAYNRHFDWMEDNAHVGCKYCADSHKFVRTRVAPD